MLITLYSLNKYYRMGKTNFHALKNINLEIKQGEFIMIMGKSGSGKTTLLNILGFLDKFNSGKYIFDGKDVSNISENMRSEYRNRYVGFIFQQFNLIHSLNIFQNIELPMIYNREKISTEEKRRRIMSSLEAVGLGDKANSYPNQLSGGQQQRVAIARALVNNPSIIFADEPTGALDSETSRDIMTVLSNLNKQGKTIIMVTHDEDLTTYASKVIRLKDGQFLMEV